MMKIGVLREMSDTTKYVKLSITEISKTFIVSELSTFKHEFSN